MESPSPRHQALAVLGGLAIGAVCLWLTTSPGAVVSNDAFDYAQMGRELARGNGGSTLQIFPRHVPFLAEHGLLDGAWPNLHRYPLPTLGNAVGHAFTEDPRRAAFLQSAASYLACTTLFAVFARWLAPMGTALLATALFAADPVLLSSASKGLSEGMGTVWVLGVLLATARPQQMTVRDGVLAGIACGLAWLTRTQLAVLLPAAVILAALRVGRRGVLATALGVALPVLPFAARQWWLTGDPLFSFSTARNLALRAAPADIDMVLDAPAHTSEVVAQHREAITKKVQKNLWRIASPHKMHALFEEWSAWALAASGIGGVIAARRHPALVASSVWLVLGSFVAVSVAFHSTRFYDPLRPIPYLLLLAGLMTLWRRVPAFPRWRRAVLAALAAVAVVALLQPTVAQGPLSTRRHRTLNPDPMSDLAAMVPADAIVVSDVSARVALFADRRSIRLPIDPEDLLTIDQDYVRVDAIVLSPRVFKDTESTRSVFANYWRYEEAMTTDAFTERWEGPSRGPAKTLVWVRRP